uniref:DNA polymerase eta n=1 Tax=Plectus sambesii TaxID=2011161 RepID=A0A914UHC3_9BILA
MKTSTAERSKSTWYVDEASSSRQMGANEQRRMNNNVVILMESSLGKQFGTNERLTDIEIERGSLLSSISLKDQDYVPDLKAAYRRVVDTMREPVYLQSCEFDGLMLCVSASKVHILKPNEAAILLAIADFEIRYRCFLDEQQFKNICALKVGDKVQVDVSVMPTGSTKVAAGKIAWIGEFDPSRGIHFGVILDEAGLGDTDGSLNGLKLFEAPPRSSVIVSADRLSVSSSNTHFYVSADSGSYAPSEAKRRSPMPSPSPALSPSPSSTLLRSGGGGGGTEHKSTALLGSVSDSRMSPSITASSTTSAAAADVTVGERIVWFDAYGQAQHGSVKWVGNLAGHVSLYAGVAFDHPIGGGTGRYGGRDIFVAPLNHASFVPVAGIMRASDFHAENKSTADRSQLSLPTSPPIRADDRVSNERASNGHSFNDFSIGACVEANYKGESRFGVVKWLGKLPLEYSGDVDAAGLELEEPLPTWWPVAERIFEGRLPFSCSLSNRAAVVPIDSLRPDHRFTTPIISFSTPIDYGQTDSGVIAQYVRPRATSPALMKDVCGKTKGIQGSRNSCYLDATLYSMFAHCDAFDSILQRPKRASDIAEYNQLIDILATEIVYPLRRFNYVRADHISKLRTLLSQLLPEISGLTTDEKDPEEILNAVFQRLFKTDPYVWLRKPNDLKAEKAYLCQVITEEAKANGQMPSVQYLLERSFYESTVEFAQVPEVLILQMPRYGTEKVFKMIAPLLEIDITHLVSNGPRPCGVCGSLAQVMCPECYLTKNGLLSAVTFCKNCFLKHATASGCIDHVPKPLPISDAARSAIADRSLPIPKQTLELVAVLCIETSHYVTFSRVGEKNCNRWVFFDSMADVREDSLKSWLDRRCSEDLASMRMALGAEIVERIRARIKYETQFHCSAGVGANKVIAKLVCARHKPRQQTIIAPEFASVILETTPLRSVRNLGGKLGKQLIEGFNIQTMGELAAIPKDALLEKLGPKVTNWLLLLAKGIDHEEVKARDVQLSIGASRNFPGKTALTTVAEVTKWLHQLINELSDRLTADRAKNGRTARSLSVGYIGATGSTTQVWLLPSTTRHCTISSCAADVLYRDAWAVLRLLNKSNTDGAWEPPMLNLSLSASKFTDGVESASKSITQFMTARAGTSKQAEADDDSIERDDDDDDTDNDLSRSPLKRKLDHPREQQTTTPDAKRTLMANAVEEEEQSVVELIDDDDQTAAASSGGSSALPTSFGDISAEVLNSLPPEIRLELTQYYRQKERPSASTAPAKQPQSKSKPPTKRGPNKKAVAKKATPTKKKSPPKKQQASEKPSAMFKISDYFTQKP